MLLGAVPNAEVLALRGVSAAQRVDALLKQRRITPQQAQSQRQLDADLDEALSKLRRRGLLAPDSSRLRRREIDAALAVVFDRPRRRR